MGIVKKTNGIVSGSKDTVTQEFLRGQNDLFPKPTTIRIPRWKCRL